MLLAYIASFSVIAIIFLGGMIYMGGPGGALIGALLVVATVMIELAKGPQSTLDEQHFVV